MRTLIFLSLIIGIGASACNKRDISNTNDQKDITAFARTGADYDGTDVKDKECGGSPTNCIMLPDVTITGSRLAALIAVANGSNSAGLAELIRSIKFADVRQALPKDVTTDLRSGLYAIKLNFNGAERFNVLVGNEFPVTYANREYTLEFSK